MEIWYWWLALAVIFYLVSRSRFKEGVMLFASDVVSVLLMMTGLVIMLNDSSLLDSAKNLAGIWLTVFGWLLFAYIFIYLFKNLLPDVYRAFEDEVKKRFG